MVHPVMRGRAAEALFHAKCLLHDLEVYYPSTQEGRVDMLVGPHYHRCQVKLLGARGYGRAEFLHITKRKGPAGSRAKFRYGAADVDFMIGVSAQTYGVYIVPISCTTPWGDCISEQALARMGCLEAFHLLHAGRGDATTPLPPRMVIGRRPMDDFRPSRTREGAMPLLGAVFQ